jgi:DNA-binding PucR family transcriptional regulator
VTTVYEALAAVMTDVDHVAKRERNTQGRGYNFRGIDSVVNAVGPALRTHKVIVVPTVLEYHYGEILSGKERTPMGHARVIVAYTFYGPDGDSIVASAAGEAFDSGDKATPKAMSVCFRTALLQALALPTDEPDPDSQTYERAPTPAASAPPLAAAKARAWNAMKALHHDWPNDELTQATETELAALGSSIAEADSTLWKALAEELEHRIPA